MEGKSDAYVLWVQNWMVDWSTEVPFATFFSGGFTDMAVINPNWQNASLLGLLLTTLQLMDSNQIVELKSVHH